MALNSVERRQRETKRVTEGTRLGADTGRTEKAAATVPQEAPLPAEGAAGGQGLFGGAWGVVVDEHRALQSP